MITGIDVELCIIFCRVQSLPLARNFGQRKQHNRDVRKESQVVNSLLSGSFLIKFTSLSAPAVSSSIFVGAEREVIFESQVVYLFVFHYIMNSRNYSVDMCVTAICDFFLWISSLHNKI